MFHVEWDNREKTIIRAVYTGALDWEEFGQADILVRAMLDSVTHKVDGIIDMTNVTFFPKEYGSIVEAGHVDWHPTLNVCVIVGSQFAYDCLIVMMHLRTDDKSPYRYAPTMEEAYAIIKAEREGKPNTAPSAPWLN